MEKEKVKKPPQKQPTVTKKKNSEQNISHEIERCENK